MFSAFSLLAIALPTGAYSNQDFLTGLYQRPVHLPRTTPASALHPPLSQASPRMATVVVLHSKRTGSLQVARLEIRCTNNRTSMAAVFPGHVMSDVKERSEILYWLDNQKNGILEFEMGEADDTLLVREGYRAVPFLKSLLAGNWLTIDAITASGETVVQEFNLANLAEAIKPVRADCNW